MTGHGRNKDPANNAHPRGSGVTGMGRRPIGAAWSRPCRSAAASSRKRVALRGGLHTRRHGLKNDYLDQAFGLGTRGAGDGRGAGTGVRHRSGAGPGRGESGRQRPVRAGLRRGLRTLERGGHPGARRAVRRGRRRGRRALRELEAAGWAPDVLVSNAGNQNRKPVVEMTPAEWQALQNVHVNGAFNCARAALPGMVRRGFGRIVLMSSVAGQATMPNIAAYATAKGAIAAFARALAVEYGGSGITCNALAPGFVRTDFTQGCRTIRSSSPSCPRRCRPDAGPSRTISRRRWWPPRRARPSSTARCWRSTAACWRACREAAMSEQNVLSARGWSSASAAFAPSTACRWPCGKAPSMP